MNKFIIHALLIFSFLPPLFGQKKNKPAQFDQIDSLLQMYYAPTQPGMAISVIQHGQNVYTKQIGMANLEAGISITDSTAFHIASVSKQFTAFLALQLASEGQLSMDDDVRKYVPELSDLPLKISLRQLANHTHGLPNLFELAQLRGIGIADRMSHREVVEMLLQINSINFSPGEAYQYNNTGYVLLAEVIERVSGKAFHQVLEEKLLAPIGMSRTFAVHDLAMLIPNRAHSYRRRGEGYQNHAFHLMANGSSGLRTTIQDLARWAIYFQQATGTDQTIFEKMQQPSLLNDGRELGYGLGLERSTYKGLDVVFHGGGDAGYRAYILHVPAHGLSVVTLGNNNDFTPRTIAYQILDLFLADHQTPLLPPQKRRYTQADLETFTGTYEFCPGVYYQILAKHDSLFLHVLGGMGELYLPTIGDGDFDYPLPDSKFSFDDEGMVFHIADFAYDCPKIELTPENNDEDLSQYVGLYKNEALNTVYELRIQDGQLVASHAFNADIILNPLAENVFFSPSGYFGRLDFKLKTDGGISGFDLSGRNLRALLFRKIE
ncbi:MAG: serine hydrolase domain-containing protein [Bacteroidota bacterium]